MCDEHQDTENNDEEGQHGEEWLSVRQVAEVAVLSFPRGAEADGDDADGTPDKERRYAGKVEQPSKDDTIAPNGCEKGQARDEQGKQKRGDGHAALIAPAKHAGSLTSTRERKEHA